MNQSERTEVRQFLEQTVTGVGQWALGEAGSGTDGIRRKPDNSFVTAADLEAERRVREAIERFSPGDAVLGEEQLEGPLAADAGSRLWVVDPIDGTTNFISGLPVWGVSAALLENGFPVAGAVAFPALAELFSAGRGDGATCNGESLQLETAAASPAAAAQEVNGEGPAVPVVTSSCANTSGLMRGLVPGKRRVLGAVTYSICAVAAGRLSVALESSPRVWDLAACWLVAEEAGVRLGVLGDRAPFPFAAASETPEAGPARNDAPLQVDPMQAYPTVAATPALFDSVYEGLRKEFARYRA